MAGSGWSTATRRAQEGLDAAHSGLQLSSLELTRLAPPQALASSFDSVQSAFIGAQTQKSEARATAEEAIPTARAQADSVVQKAHADADSDLAAAVGAADAFRALEKEYRANSGVVREPLYRDAVEKQSTLQEAYAGFHLRRERAITASASRSGPTQA